jgi:RNA recognition motif-containing protein
MEPYEGEPSIMSRLFLGNIPHAASETDISDWMQSQGFIVESVDIIRDRNTGNPRGFGFATLVDEKQLESAVKSLNGRLMGGRQITVNRAVPLNLKGNEPRRRIA